SLPAPEASFLHERRKSPAFFHGGILLRTLSCPRHSAWPVLRGSGTGFLFRKALPFEILQALRRASAFDRAPRHPPRGSASLVASLSDHLCWCQKRPPVDPSSFLSLRAVRFDPPPSGPATCRPWL